jgi:hypothetical protein
MPSQHPERGLVQKFKSSFNTAAWVSAVGIPLWLNFLLDLPQDVATNLAAQQVTDPSLLGILVACSLMIMISGVAIGYNLLVKRPQTIAPTIEDEDIVPKPEFVTSLCNQQRNLWINDFLHKSLHHTVLGQGKADDNLSLSLTNRPWSLTLQRAGGSVEELITQQGLFSKFQEFQRGSNLLLIEGNAGAGKTTEVLELLDDLIEEAEKELYTLTPASTGDIIPDKLKIPVYLRLHTWKKEPLDEWLVIQVENEYHIPAREVRKWIAENYIRPLLDGFDEMPKERWESCVKAIKKFCDEFYIPVLVCFRTDQQRVDMPFDTYRTIRIRVQPLSISAIDDYLKALEGANRKVAGLREALSRDEELYKLAQTPLFLNVMTLAYPDEEKVKPPMGDVDPVRKLFSDFVNQMFKRYDEKRTRYSRESREVPYTEDTTLSGLYWLAKTVKSTQTFRLENVQHDQLPKPLERWYTLVDRLGGALLIGMILCFIFIGAISLYAFLFLRQFHFDVLLLDGVIFGFMAALVTGFFGGKREASTYPGFKVALNAAWGFLLIGAIGSVIGGLTVSALLGKLGVGLIFGVAGMLAGALAGAPSIKPRKVFAVEILTWKAERARWAILIGFGIGLLVGGGVSLGLGSVSGIIGGVVKGVFGGILGGLAGGFLFGLLMGWTGEEGKVTDETPQGTRRLTKNILKGSVIGWAAAGLVVALVSAGFVSSLIFGLLGALIGTLAFGGYALISHLVLRFFLWYSGQTPPNYSKFLDYCVQLNFLRNVKSEERSGYVFIHPVLKEYFAGLTANFHPPVMRTGLGVLKTGMFAVLFVLVITVFLIWLPVSQGGWRSTSVTLPSRGDEVLLVRAHLVTDIHVGSESKAIVTATGTLSTGPFVGEIGPDGTERGFLGLPVGDGFDQWPSSPHGALMCKLTTEDVWHYCGRNYEFSTPRSGYLEFDVNDNEPDKHTGYFQVDVSVQNRNSP